MEKIEQLQIKSLLIVKYISSYAYFEKLIKDIFQKEIINVDHKHKSKLYFLYGSTVGNDIFYNYETESLDLNGRRKYNDSELFKTLNINKIIRFDRKEKIIEPFKFDITSIQTPMQQYAFHDSCLKLINMRNKLAHELDSIVFKSSIDIIETLSFSTIEHNQIDWLKDFDLSKMDDMALAIYSNIIYMNIITGTLQSVTNP